MVHLLCHSDVCPLVSGQSEHVIDQVLDSYIRWTPGSPCTLIGLGMRSRLLIISVHSLFGWRGLLKRQGRRSHLLLDFLIHMDKYDHQQRFARYARRRAIWQYVLGTTRPLPCLTSFRLVLLRSSRRRIDAKASYDAIILPCFHDVFGVYRIRLAHCNDS